MQRHADKRIFLTAVILFVKLRKIYGNADKIHLNKCCALCNSKQVRKKFCTSGECIADLFLPAFRTGSRRVPQQLNACTKPGTKKSTHELWPAHVTVKSPNLVMEYYGRRLLLQAKVKYCPSKI